MPHMRSGPPRMLGEGTQKTEFKSFCRNVYRFHLPPPRFEILCP